MRKRELTSLTEASEIIFLHRANEIATKAHKIQIMPRKAVYYISFGAINHGFFTVIPSSGNGKRSEKKKPPNPFGSLFPKKELIILLPKDGFSDITFLTPAN